LDWDALKHNRPAGSVMIVTPEKRSFGKLRINKTAALQT
jgi:hypothetical protein